MKNDFHFTFANIEAQYRAAQDAGNKFEGVQYSDKYELAPARCFRAL